MDELLLIILSSAIGTSFGVISGLIPGIHVNNIALILLSFSPVMMKLYDCLSSFLNLSIDDGFSCLCIASMIIAASVAHTFLDFIPATLLGAPEGETALAILPAHEMLLDGRAYEAIALSAMGSFASIILSFVLIVPFYFLFSEPLNLYEIMREAMLYILIGISAVLILTESLSERLMPLHAVSFSLIVFLLSGIFGYLILNTTVKNLVEGFLYPPSMIFPALTGLFGTSTLIYSAIHEPEIPPQEIREPEVELSELFRSISSGTIFGSIIGFLPGITPAHATIMAMLARRNRRAESIMLTLSCVNTANSIFCLVALFMTLRARSGAVLAVEEILDVQKWQKFSAIPPNLIYLLMVVLISALLSYFITRGVGRYFSIFIERVPYKMLVFSVIVFLSFLTLLFTGYIGLIILFIGTCIGLVPVCIGVRRSNCMGVLLLPIIISLW